MMINCVVCEYTLLYYFYTLTYAGLDIYYPLRTLFNCTQFFAFWGFSCALLRALCVHRFILFSFVFSVAEDKMQKVVNYSVLTYDSLA